MSQTQQSFESSTFSLHKLEETETNHHVRGNQSKADRNTLVSQRLHVIDVSVLVFTSVSHLLHRDCLPQP